MLKKTIITTILCLIAVNVFAVEKKDPVADVVRQEIMTFMQDNAIPGVAVEIYMNGVPHSYYFGMADVEKKKPVNAKTIFELGSITKLYTGLLLADEVDSAKLQLNDSISSYLPQLPAEYEDITFLNLATHTAGLPFNAPESVNSDKTLLAYLQNWTPENSADTERSYSNLGMRILALAIERVEKKDLNELYIKKIFNRLKMQPIGLRVPNSYLRFYAQGYDASGKPVPAMKVDESTGAGGAKGMAMDMQRFLAASIGLSGTPERLLYPMRLMQAPYVQVPDFSQGLAWDIHPLTEDASITRLLSATDNDYLHEQEILSIDDKPVFDETALIDKTGATDGFRSYIAVLPDKKSGIVILANKQVSGKPIVITGRKILFKLNHIEAKETKETNENHDEATSIIKHILPS